MGPMRSVGLDMDLSDFFSLACLLVDVVSFVHLSLGRMQASLGRRGWTRTDPGASPGEVSQSQPRPAKVSMVKPSRNEPTVAVSY